MTRADIAKLACDCAGPEYHQTGNPACAISILLAQPRSGGGATPHYCKCGFYPPASTCDCDTQPVGESATPQEQDHSAGLAAVGNDTTVASDYRQAAMTQAESALLPFSWIGDWLFARNAPDDEPLVMLPTINNSPDQVLTRGQFKAASNARMALIKARSRVQAEQCPRCQQMVPTMVCLKNHQIGDRWCPDSGRNMDAYRSLAGIQWVGCVPLSTSASSPGNQATTEVSSASAALPSPPSSTAKE